MPPLRILYATPECAPLVKTGGLGDVAGALPVALRRIGLDARVLLPGYRPVLAALPGARDAGRIEAIARLPEARLLEAELPHGVPAWIIDCPALYDRDGGPYQDAGGVDWEDNPLRFGLLSHVAARLASTQSPVAWRAQLVHANDWQTGLAPAYAALALGGATPSIITIHNLAFQGSFAPHWVADLGLPATSFAVDGVEYYGRLSFLKAGLFFANAITTVSPTYAQEIQSEAMGMGLHGLLTTRRDSLTGILNGIDTTVWDPASDALIPERYDATTLERKAANKRALQIRFGLDPAWRHSAAGGGDAADPAERDRSSARYRGRRPGAAGPDRHRRDGGQGARTAAARAYGSLVRGAWRASSASTKRSRILSKPAPTRSSCRPASSPAA